VRPTFCESKNDHFAMTGSGRNSKTKLENKKEERFFLQAMRSSGANTSGETKKPEKLAIQLSADKTISR